MKKENSSGENSQYIHGSSPIEQDRLSLLNTLLNKRSLHKLEIKGGEKVLDVGSGLGQLSRGIARKVGSNGKVIGIERDEKQLLKARKLAKEEGEAGLVDFRSGDAFAMPLHKEEWGSFDLVHTRFLLEHLTKPEKVVSEMVRAAKPGGKIVLADDDHSVLRIYPEPVGFSEIWGAYCRSYDRIGNDPYIGRRLVALLKEAGLKKVWNDTVFFADCAGNSNFEAYVENLIGVVDGAKELMFQERLIDEKTYEKGIEYFRAWSERPDATLWYSFFWAAGIKD